MSFLFRRTTILSISALSATAGGVTYYYRTNSNHNDRHKKMLPSYEATFSVPLECDACVNDIKSALSKIDGISSTHFSIPTRLITITSTTAPSTLISTIQSTGRDAILRGSGKPNSAAVCILEIPPTHHTTPSSSATKTANGTKIPTSTKYDSPVRGLARLIQISSKLTLLDLTLTSLPSGRYHISVRRTGDISSGSASLGPVYNGEDGSRVGVLGEIEISERDKRGNLVGEIGWEVWELVGRGICVEPIVKDGEARGEVCGVVARSAGVWENEKVVCGCSGKTVWEEREEMVGKGML
ncbi:MAG: hypothetical protein Q9218_008275 [Villophora microphyllina]